MLVNELKFNTDGKFRIMVATDMHEKPDITSEKGKLKYKDMLKLMNTALDTLKPDLVVLNGDTCTDHGGTDDEFMASFREQLRRILSPMLERGVPVAAVLGNHEHDTSVNRIEMMRDAYNEYDGVCMLNDCPDITGMSNYNLLVNGAEGKPKLNLWFIDSNNCCDDKSISTYDWVHGDQIEWYERRARELANLNGGEVIPALLFQHIPVNEEYELLRKARPWEIPSAVRGHGLWNKDFYILADGVEGYLGEGPCAPYYHEGQFESWKHIGDVMGAFFGHDHLNDFCGKVDGIVLAQCKTAGFRAYTDGCRSGVRLITVDEQDVHAFETEMYHFKDFGLKSESLGPIESRITDRQSVNLTIASRIAIGAAAVSGAAYLAVRLFKRKK